MNARKPPKALQTGDLTDLRITAHASDGEAFPCDRAGEVHELWFACALALTGPEEQRGKNLIAAGFYALWRAASDITTGDGWPGGVNPWDVVQAYGEALGKYGSEEARTLGKAFGAPDHKGRTAVYGPHRVKRDGLKIPRETAIFRDCLERFRDTKRTRAVVFAEVGELHKIGADRVAQIFNRMRKALREALARDPLKPQ
jgi:hypothetical protein